MLELRPNCEWCDRDLPPDALDAMICTYECTFCADCVETVMGAQWYDANISVVGCDKNMPGSVIAMGRLNRPSIMVYGGTIQPGHYQGKTLDIVSAFEGLGACVAGKITQEELTGILQHAVRAPGLVGECIRPIPWRPPSRPWG